MKPLIVLTLLLAVVAGSASLHAADFEGKVRMKMTSGHGTPHSIDYAVKSGLVRTEFAGGKSGGTTMIMSLARREMTILMPAQHMYLVQPLPAAKPGTGAAAADSASSFTPTGETEKILGYDCMKYVVKTKDGATDLWLTEQLGAFSGLNGGNPAAAGGRGPAAAAWERVLAGKNFFPMRVVSKNAAGDEQVRLEVESVEPQSLPDALFAPPPDYKKLDMGGMMRGLGAPSAGN